MLIIITIFLHENVVACSEGNADEDKEKIGNGEIQDQQVRCVLHLRVRHHLANIDADDIDAVMIQDLLSEGLLCLTDDVNWVLPDIDADDID